MSITITPGDVISWLIIAAIAGWILGITLRRRSTHIDLLINFGIGLAGEALGRALFWLLPANANVLPKITISVQDIVAALIGTLVVFAILWFARKRVLGCERSRQSLRVGLLPAHNR